MPLPAPKQRPAVTSHGRTDSKGAAIRRGDLKISDPIQLPQGVSHGINQQSTMGTPSHPATAPTPPLEGTWPRKSVSPAFHMRTRSNGADEPQGQGAASSNAISRISAGPSMLNGNPSRTPSKGSLGKQKDAGFRAKIRRVFGSQRLRETTHSSGTGARHSQTQSPHNLTSVSSSNQNQPTRTSSKPVSELTRSSALGSHSAKPLEQPQASHQGLTTSNRTEGPVSRHRRRNTLPSVALSFHEAQMLAATLGEVGMRPSSKPPLHHSDGERAGNLKRCSRSADELRDEVRSHQISSIQWRRRSGEIQYWRNSVVENPIPERRGTERDAYHSLESERLHIRSFAPSPSTAPRSPYRDALRQFQFGSFSDAGGPTATVEQRLTTLEVKFIDHEYAIAELQGCDITRPVASAGVPKRRSVKDIFPETSDPQFSTSTASQGHTFLSSPADSPTPADDFDHCPQHHRSSNVPTLRPTTDNSPYSNLITAEPFDAVMALIAAEQAARRKLEDQVSELQAQVDELRNASYLPRRPSAYPTPSPESRHSTLASRGHLTRRLVGLPRSRVGSDETSRFSVTDADESDTENGFLDSFETPRETQESRSGFESNHASPIASMI